MAVSLTKGHGISLKKSEHDLSQVTIGLGWDVIEKKIGVFGKLIGKKQEDYDLDAVAFLLTEQNKVKNIGFEGNLVNSDVIFFNNLEHSSGSIRLTGDNRTGEGDGDDEQIIVDLNQLPQIYKKIIFIVQIYQGISKSQNFGEINNAFIRAVDKQGIEMARFDLSRDPSLVNCHSVIIAELDRQGQEWKFKAIGKPYTTDNFISILKEYI